MSNLRIERLDRRDVSTAKALFGLLAEVFGERYHAVGDAYIETVLRKDSFWALAALDGDEVVGGLTAHVIPMTNSESQEMFIYDIAVRSDHQRKKIGRRLMNAVIELARLSAIARLFVLADNHDSHALAFYLALGGRPSMVTCFEFASSRVDRA